MKTGTSPLLVLKEKLYNGLYNNKKERANDSSGVDISITSYNGNRNDCFDTKDITDEEANG